MNKTGASKGAPESRNDLVISVDSPQVLIVINIQRLVIPSGVEKQEVENMITGILKGGADENIKFQYPETGE